MIAICIILWKQKFPGLDIGTQLLVTQRTFSGMACHCCLLDTLPLTLCATAVKRQLDGADTGESYQKVSLLHHFIY